MRRPGGFPRGLARNLLSAQCPQPQSGLEADPRPSLRNMIQQTTPSEATTSTTAPSVSTRNHLAGVPHCQRFALEGGQLPRCQIVEAWETPVLESRAQTVRDRAS